MPSSGGATPPKLPPWANSWEEYSNPPNAQYTTEEREQQRRSEGEHPHRGVDCPYGGCSQCQDEVWTQDDEPVRVPGDEASADFIAELDAETPRPPSWVPDSWKPRERRSR